MQTMPRQWLRLRGRPYNTLGSVDLEYVIVITCVKSDLEEILCHCLSSGEGGAKGERAARYKNIIPRGRESIVESNSSLFIKFNFLQHSNFKRYVQFEEEVNAMLVTFKCACRSSQPKMTKKLTHLSSFISAEMKAWRTSEEKPRREPRWSSSTPSICRCL